MNQSIGDKVSCSSPSRLTRSSPYSNHNKNNHATSFKQSNMINAELPELVPKKVVTNTDDFKIGDRVWVGGLKPGIIAFIGEVNFSPGEWAGVVLDSPVGKNDGSVNGLRYFMCEPKRGIFSTLTKLSNTYTNDQSSSNEAKNLSGYKTLNLDNKSSGDHSNKLKGPKDLKINTLSKHMSDIGLERSLQTDTLPRKSLQMELSPIPQSNSGASNHKSSIGSISSQSSGKVEDFLNNRLDIPFKVGDRVLVSGLKEGIVRFIGQADFARGVWVGVELKKAMGKNDGSVAGKRYFQCPAMHGLFAPVHKVEVCRTPVRAPPQPRSQSNLGDGSVSKSNSHNSGFTNRGSQESLSSIGSAASSASRRMKLGVTSLTGHRTKGAFHNAPTLSSYQKTLKEKEDHIEQLIKERDLDRSEFIRTAAQIDEVENKLVFMQSEKKRFMVDTESKMRQAEELIMTLEGEKNDLRIQLMEERRKYEDIQFSLEETSIEKSDIQSQIEKDSRRLKELDEKLKNEMHLNDKLSNEVKSLKILGLSKDDPIDEYLDQIEELTHKLCVAENKLKVYENGQMTSTNSCGNVESKDNCCDAATHDASLPSPDHPPGLKNHLKMVAQKKLFVETQREELEADLKKVSAEKDLIELELSNLIEDHRRVLEEKEKLMKERMMNHKMIHEAGNQIKNFEQKVEKVTCEFASRMETLRRRAETAEMDAQVLRNEQKPLKGQIHELNLQIKHLTSERDSLIAEIHKLKNAKQENKKESRNVNFSNNKSNEESKDVGLMSIGIGASLIEKLKSEKDFAESQIDFLNAVIVDLQKKNTDLENRLKIAESSKSMTDSLLYMNGTGQKPATVRLFCDICDVFDLHDTDDCPMQNMTSSPLNASLHHGNRDEERPYCSSCEVFGHATDQCKDEQTY